MKTNNLAIIPARSGSKGIKDKNIRQLNNKPLISYTIMAAIDSGCFDMVMVSTDSRLYADIANDYGAKTPFLRSVNNSRDTSSTWDVVREVLEYYEKDGIYYDSFCVLQPTSPLRTAEDIRSAYELYYEKEAIGIVSMTQVEHPISWCNEIGKDLSIDGFMDHNDYKQRQMQSVFYRPNGAIYIANSREFKKNAFLYREGSYAYVMPAERSIDIDSELDFIIADAIMKSFL